MIYNLISSSTVISKVLADLDIKESDARISDMREWIAEAIEKVGSVNQLTRHVSGENSTPYLKVSGFQAKIPANLYRMNRVAFSTTETGPWLPMQVNAGNFMQSTSAIQSPGLSGDASIIELTKTLYSVDDAGAIKLLNENPAIRSVLFGLVKGDSVSASVYDGGLKYYVKPGYIVTNVKDGWLKLNYDSIPVDQDGCPLMPDLMSYIEAAYWYVVMKLKYPDYLNGKMDQGRYYDIRRSWNFYCQQAYAESLMPNEDGMETIKNVWHKLIPEFNAGDSFYAVICSQQRIKTK
jgi:hypothetical protein